METSPAELVQEVVLGLVEASEVEVVVVVEALGRGGGRLGGGAGAGGGAGGGFEGHGGDCSFQDAVNGVPRGIVAEKLGNKGLDVGDLRVAMDGGVDKVMEHFLGKGGNFWMDAGAENDELVVAEEGQKGEDAILLIVGPRDDLEESNAGMDEVAKEELEGDGEEIEMALETKRREGKSRV
ncbi:hypothetical protein J5N97_008685 [Dioscorea zingiberensis]|uniref:Uncharacterized protein n=1 Tax=Dioscorea zingiberensis TaxID=325984 RepID=A0A9D5HKS6_9LILI|nr:hypothetical protein J5N97_008685 [Dioscorea zingiberensis]